MKIHEAIKHYFKRLLGLLLALVLLKVVFLMYNSGAFQNQGFTAYFQSFLVGVYFDYIYSFYVLVPVLILCFFLPFLFRYKGVRLAESIYYGVLVLLTTVFACIDAAYYPFVKSHVGGDLLFFLQGDNNISPFTYIANYWQLFLICILLPILIWWIGGKTVASTKGYTWWALFPRIGLLLILFLLVRGGFRLRPVGSLDAVLFAPAQMEALVVNPEFVFLESLLNKSELQFDDQLDIRELEKTNRKRYANQVPVVLNGQIQDFPERAREKPNIVLVILESFGKEFTSLNEAGLPSYTPFLDSLMRVSVCFENAYANGQKSKDAIPALMTGIPSLIREGFSTSPYANNDLPSLPKILEEEGYVTSFYHGANNSSMGFRNYLLQHGLQHYYGIDEYLNTERDFDGHWGIFDDAYLRYFADELSRSDTPFFASVFTLSSHDPYAIPDTYRSRITRGEIKLHRSIQYADMALADFFKIAQTKDWYSNTWFIITADHSSLNQTYQYQSGTGKFEVPLLAYYPGDSLVKKVSKPVMHMDLLPSLLHLIHYPDSVTTLGESMFDSKVSPMLFREGETFYLLEDGWELKAVDGQPVNLYNLSNDPSRKSDLLESNQARAEDMLKQIKKLNSNLAKKLIFNDFR